MNKISFYSQFLPLLLSGVVASAQTNWKAQTGLFNNASNWSTGVPTFLTDASVTNGTSTLPSVVNLGPGQTGAVRNLTLNSSATFNINRGSRLDVYGQILSNSGDLNISAGGGSDSMLALHSNVSLTGGGTVTLNSGDNNGRATIPQLGIDPSLTNVDNTIQGYGTIGLYGWSLTNERGGTIVANSNGNALTLIGTGTLTNTGLLSAANGGALNLAISGTVASGGGLIQAETASTINIGIAGHSTVVSGAALITIGSGVINNVANTWLSYNTRLLPGSTFQSNAGTTTYLTGQIINRGNIQINSATLSTLGSTDLRGAGTITLNNGVLQQSSPGSPLTNFGNIIQGYGAIGGGGLVLTNGTDGTILANVSGQTLSINTLGGLTNNGTMQVDSGSFMQITGNLPNNGKVVLGADSSGTGHLFESGNYTQNSKGKLVEMISSSTFHGEFDVLGNLFLGGILDIELVDSFTPTFGESFTLLRFSGSYSGLFTSIIGSDPLDWRVLYNPGNNGQIDLVFNGSTTTTPPSSAVPEPATWSSAVFLVAVILISRTRRNNKSA